MVVQVEVELVFLRRDSVTVHQVDVVQPVQNKTDSISISVNATQQFLLSAAGAILVNRKFVV